MMSILTAYAGLSIAFLITVSLFLYIFIYTKLNVVLKLILIPVIIWFSLALYYVSPNFMGWPVSAEPPDKSVILCPVVKEPQVGKKGFIDLLVILQDQTKPSLLDQLNPVSVFKFSHKNTERLFRLPYSRALHKRLMEAQRKAGEKRGFMRYMRAVPNASMGKGKNKKMDNAGIPDIVVVDPNEFLPKKE